MSYIKRLKLKGFKSFANPTVINFEKGFNTIVGANGSGKSNVFDALCFVLGRLSSKGLRAEKLGNLVFNGGKALKASKDAEVCIFLDNTNQELLNVDLDEIKVSRIVKNTGESTYYLNNNKVTRTEILEVLKRANIDPDGYNIILQGDITRIVSMSNIERRQLIEEIADISGYEDKRQKSLKKLDVVENDLKDADLLMEEKTKYLKDLRHEKDQAEKFHKTKDDLRFNSLLLVKSKIVRNIMLKQKKEEELEKNEVEIAKFKEKLDEFEGKSKQIDEEITAIEKEIEIKSHNDFISVTNLITSLQSELQNLNEKRADLKKQSLELKQRIEQVKENIKNNKNSIEKYNKDIKELEDKKSKLLIKIQEKDAQLSKFKENISASGLDELDEIDTQIDELANKRQNKDLIKQDNNIQIEKLNTKIEHFQEELNKMHNVESENKEQVKELEGYRKKLKQLIIDISNTATKNSESAAKLNNLEKEYSALIEDYSRLKMKAQAANDLIATNKAVDTIVKLAAKDSKIHGTVAQLASVPNKYSLALETAAGKALFNVVVEDDQVAVKYINYLKENRVGNATFLPLNKINAKYRLDDKVLNKKGVIDYALNLIKYDSRYENVFNLIYTDTIVIESIEYAKSIGIGEYRMITLDGDIVAKSGAMSGGFKSNKKGVGAFADDKLNEQLASLETRVSSLKGSIDQIKHDKDDSERKLYDLRQEKMEVEGNLSKIEKILSIEGKDPSQINKEIEAIISDKAVIEGSLKKIEKEINIIDEDIKELRSKKDVLKSKNLGSGNIVSKINEVEEQKDKLKEELNSINSQINSKNIQINNVLNPEIINLEKISQDSNTSIEKIKEQLTYLDTTIKEKDELLKENKAKEKELSKDYKQYIDKRDNLKEEKKKLETKYESVFEKFDKVKEKSSGLRYAISEYETLNNTLNDDLELMYNEIKIEFSYHDHEKDEKIINEEKINELIDQVDNKLQNSSIDVKELQNKVNNLKARLNSFGSINMKAVEIYDKLQEEFNLLLEKRETLNTDKAEILGFVAQMDEKKKERFIETYNTLQENFRKIYLQLSSKGDAELEIEDEKNLFESGVEIKVRLSQKNMLDIKSLSGGEKTITAVAFIFAVQEFNPAHFYIFDEIDAALDILNSEKLGKLIGQHAHRAQYIVVSHSEYLIQSSQNIYGVTMDKNKVSGIVSLDLSTMKDYVDTEEATK